MAADGVGYVPDLAELAGAGARLLSLARIARLQPHERTDEDGGFCPAEGQCWSGNLRRARDRHPAIPDVSGDLLHGAAGSSWLRAAARTCCPRPVYGYILRERLYGTNDRPEAADA